MKKTIIAVMFLVGLSACNTAPKEFVIGSRWDSSPAWLPGISRYAPLPTDERSQYMPVTHPWKLKVGQQIRFSVATEFLSACITAVDRRSAVKKAHGSSGPCNTYASNELGIMEDAPGGFGGVVVGRYIGSAFVCVYVAGDDGGDGTRGFGFMDIDVVINGITRKRTMNTCSHFEVVQ